MAWIESHQEIGLHPKTRKAARIAGTSVPTMVGHLHLIWHWALDFAQDGNITSFEPWQIEDAAMWEGAEQALFDALRLAGYLDVNNDGECLLHHWGDYAGKLIERRRADAARKRGESAKNPPEPTKENKDIQRNSDGTPPEGDGTAERNFRNSNLNRTVTINDDTLAPDGANEHNGLTALDGGKAPPKPIERRFNRFWHVYPKKRSKQDAWKVWQRLNPDDALTDRMIASIAALRRTQDWKKQDGQFIPYPASWLNAGGWDDETAVELRGDRDETPGNEHWWNRPTVTAG